jgi:two-component system response regulator AtoC
LAAHFLRQHSESAFFSAEAEERLCAYDWPGNVRELRNVVTGAIIRAKGYEIGPYDLGALEPAHHGSLEGFGLQLAGLEREAIREALRQTGGHHQQAADLLGISRRTLTRKLKLYGSPEPVESRYTYGTVPRV